MDKVIFPGTFDPPTAGHLNIIKKASKMFKQVVVAIGSNSQKHNGAFDVKERIEFLETMTSELPNVKVAEFQGLLVDFAKEQGIKVVVKGLRNGSDFDSETLQADMNRKLGDLETVYLTPDEEFRNISSSLVREVGRGGRRLTHFVPQEIEQAVYNRLRPNK